MRTALLIISLVLLMVLPSLTVRAETPVGGLGIEIDPSTENPYPDLLGSDEGGTAPDLLDDEPYIRSPEELLGDPIFEDDFSFEDPSPEINDPLEPLNRAIFVFNDKVYFWVFKPTKNAYSYILPDDIRRSIGNAFANIAAPIRFLNNVLQGEFEDAGVVLSRFAINTTLGVFGFGDPAFDMAYLATSRVNLLSISPDVYEELKRISLDPYVAARQGYYDYRRSIIAP
ncbi:MAG: MlaA family lipoprotein [Desulfofustis sp.]